MRYALLIPVLFVSVWMISCEKAVTQVPTAEVDQLPEFPGGNEGLVAFFQKDFEYPEELKSDNIEGPRYFVLRCWSRWKHLKVKGSTKRSP